MPFKTPKGFRYLVFTTSFNCELNTDIKLYKIKNVYRENSETKYKITKGVSEFTKREILSGGLLKG